MRPNGAGYEVVHRLVKMARLRWGVIDPIFAAIAIV
jgi:hypothetical protein